MCMSETLGFHHRYVVGNDPTRPPLLLLHGTGGDENDLPGLGAQVAPGASLLSPRGKVVENGMPRFFRRLAEGVFDEADVRARANELADFINAARDAYGLEAPIALGFSNGANIAAALLWLRPEVLAGAVLLRAMRPLSTSPEADIAGKRVLIVNGAADPLIPAKDSVAFAQTLTDAGASVDLEVLPTGHGLIQADMRLMQQYLSR
jgi:phospholipase/carboxylesterase